MGCSPSHASFDARPAFRETPSHIEATSSPIASTDMMQHRDNEHISRVSSANDLHALTSSKALRLCFSMQCAVSLHWLVNVFLEKHPDIRLRPYTTGAVTYELIKAAVKDRGCRYVDLIKDDSGTQISRGRSFYFISHGWGRPFIELVDQIIEHFKPENQIIWRPKGASILKWEEIYIWLDIFAINQNAGASQGNDLSQLKEVVEDCDQTLMILDKEGSVLTRIWCLFEAWHTGKKGSGALRLLCYGVDFNIFFRIFRNLTILRAEATVQTDLTMILNAIRDDVGIETLDMQLKRALVESLTGEIPSEDEPWTSEIGARLTKAAKMLAESGSMDEAEVLLRRSLKGQEEASSSDTEATLTLLTAWLDFASNLDQWGSQTKAEKESERGKGRRAEALAIYRRVLRDKETLIGSDQPETLEVVKKLAYLMQDLEDRRGAISLLRRLVDASAIDQDEILALASLLSDGGEAEREEAIMYEEMAKKLPARKFKFVPSSMPGYAKFEVRRSVFEIEERYQPLTIMGEGQFSVAVCCKDSEVRGDEKVAIKKLTRVFDDTFEANRVLHETMIQSRLSGSPCLVNLKRMIKPFPLYRDTYDDIYFVMDFYESDLSRIIRSKQALTEDHYKYLMTQLLMGLQHLHSRGIVRNDLKPNNLMVNSDCSLAIGDLGSATTLKTRERQMDHPDASGGYVGARWYRAPEKLVESFDLASATKGDLWACGCILGELLGRAPMFPGRDSIDSLKKIIAVIGKPLPEDLQGVNPQAVKFLYKLPAPASDVKGSMSLRFPNADPQAIDLLSSLLTFNPSKRLSAYEALKHPWIYDSLEDENRVKIEALEAEGVRPLSFDWEGEERVKIEDARRILYEEAKRSQSN